MAQKRIYALDTYIQLAPADPSYIDPATIQVALDIVGWAESKKYTLDHFTAYTLFTEEFEEDDGTPTAHVLAHTAQTAGAVVSLNGSIVAPSNYTLTGSTITVNLPVAQYDTVVITYQF